jgi:hypothetical protein
MKTRIAQYDFQGIAGCRIPFQRCFEVFLNISEHDIPPDVDI